MNAEHRYALKTVWSGNRGTGTSGYTAYGREHRIEIPGKAILQGSSDTPFQGDAALHNPEDMLLASLSACHMLCYLHLCADAGIRVIEYEDEASATMIQSDSGGSFREAILRPNILIAAGGDPGRAAVLHQTAHQHCFIANSVNFPVRHEPTIRIEDNL